MEHLVSTTNHEQNDYFNEANATFGDRLAAARQAKGLDVDGLSEKLGVDVETVKVWERDADMPHANRIQMLAGLLNVSMVWLVSGEGNGTSEVADTFERPVGVNDALGEISQLKATLSGAVEKLDKLQERLQNIP
jgi:transcriptional regulator with XRE-family HTH domain|tara:strand:+ start:306 stop:710 length:405 start_codon:yes stop_codon:yes gene_type:complete